MTPDEVEEEVHSAPGFFHFGLMDEYDEDKARGDVEEATRVAAEEDDARRRRLPPW